VLNEWTIHVDHVPLTRPTKPARPLGTCDGPGFGDRAKGKITQSQCSKQLGSKEVDQRAAAPHPNPSERREPCEPNESRLLLESFWLW